MSPADFLRTEAIRDQVNHWIRSSGDFLHPNDAGYRAIAATINPNEL